jgi:hypothetical protein
MPYAADFYASQDAKRRLSRIHAKRQVIEPARLEELAGDPKLKSGKIAALFGYGRAAFFTHLSQDHELWNVYATARVSAGHQVTKAHLLSKRGILAGDELRIIEAIDGGARTYDAIAAASEVDSHIFAARLYNLENEKHEIWSQAIGCPPVTHYFLRSEEPAQAKGAAA